MNRILLVFLCALPLMVRAQNKLMENNPTMLVNSKRWVKNDPNQPWKDYKTIIVDSVKEFAPMMDIMDEVNVYGSDAHKTTNATGFFYTKKIGKRWWMVDPFGHIHFHRGINSFRPGGSSYQKECYNKCFKDDQTWISQSRSLFAGLGFYCAGSWSEYDKIRTYNATNDNKLAYTINLNFMSSYGKKRGGTYPLPGNTGYPNQTIFVFDPEFETFCMEHAKKCAHYADDPNLVGYFSDNELPFGLKNLDGYLSLTNANDPGRIAAETFLRENGVDRGDITDRERMKFAGIVAERYYEVVERAIRKYDSNHLYVGSRLHGGAKFLQSVVEAAGRHCDVLSINYYGVWTPSVISMDEWNRWANKPFWITEFYTKANDVGLENKTGAGFTVNTQKDRGYAYQHFCLALLQAPNCVGWDWFRYQDNDPTDSTADRSNLDSNKGIINSRYELYTDLARFMEQLNQQVYSLINYIDHHYE